ncbi:hypothetical protein [Wohlfahrtiimonas larvae]|uniref:Uncharacterized protein n=1 Tax=Wohlfahrtiimonas larvae TaxID=1157986 RepID=A0ABP9MRW8_9GAMM|nr:hypothetical protein [Wohlfahrtiimonas larvae]
MFEKITISITTLLIVMFITLYYYQSGTEPPQECIDLHQDYIKLSKLVDSDKYHVSARKIFSKEKILYIHSIEKHYHRLLKERFRRSGYDDFKVICINAKKTMNLPAIIQALKEQTPTNPLDKKLEHASRQYDFTI